MDEPRHGAPSTTTNERRGAPSRIPTVDLAAPVCVALTVRDPAVAAESLERLGAPRVVSIADEPSFGLGTDRLVIRRGRGSDPLGITELHPPALDDGAMDGPRVVAFGLATVDQARFVRDLDLGEVAAGPDEELLGAWSWRPVASSRIVVLEPSVDGRLAAALARGGEGPLILYLASGTGLGTGGRPTALGRRGTLLELGPGPLAPNVIVVPVDAGDG
jgi:hypothetical protein